MKKIKASSKSAVTQPKKQLAVISASDSKEEQYNVPATDYPHTIRTALASERIGGFCIVTSCFTAIDSSMLFLRILGFASVCALNFSQPQSYPVVNMLVPGFTVEELPVKISNQNNLRFAPDGTLTSLGYDGRVWKLRDSDGDGLEDVAEPFWKKPTLSVPLGMCWSTDGLLVSSKGKVSLLKDTDKDGEADLEEIITSGWPGTDVGSGGVDATAVTMDREGNIYFGLLVADYSNAYRLRKRTDLKPENIAWLKQAARWREPTGPNAEQDEFSLYDLQSRRGTIQKWDPHTKQLTTIATGIRVPVALAFNRAGDLFNTDQEGETWMPNGNPLDELNHIIAGRHYGFPPRHERWLPGILSEPPVVGFGPQHQSACGLVFNDPHPALNKGAIKDLKWSLPAAPAQSLFGPESWNGNAFVAGESRAKIWRVELVKSPDGYVGRVQTIARLSMLTMDLAISPDGELYVCTHSGPPDWGSGPKGIGKIFKITYKDHAAPIPLIASPVSATEVRVKFDKPLNDEVTQLIPSTKAFIEFGEYVSAGDRFEVLKPPYAVVQQQDTTPRGRLAIHQARVEADGKTLILTTDAHPLAVRYTLTLPGIKGVGQSGEGKTIDLEYDLTVSSQPRAEDPAKLSPANWNDLVSWAPQARASAGTDSRPPRKPEGDWEHGRSLFFSEKLQCGKCHRVRGVGGIAGPDLSNLIHRDATSILRDIQQPSATLHPDYITYEIATKDGELVQGFVRSQNESSIRLFDVNGIETVLSRSQVETFRPTEFSLMPSGLLEGRKDNDIRDLLTFLLWEPPQRSKAEIQTLNARLDKEPSPKGPIAKSHMRIVLVASKQDHGDGQHDYPTWQSKWSHSLTDSENKTTVDIAREWPSKEQFDSANVVVFYFWNHNWSAGRLAQLDAYLKRGGGIALIHSAVIADKDPEQLSQRIGLSAQPGRTDYRHMPFELKLIDREHPITRGFPERIDLLDEPYWPLIGSVADAHVLATAKVDGQERPLVWVKQNGKGRIFASIPGHYTWTLDDPIFQKVLLRGIAWAAGADAGYLKMQ